MNWDNYDSSITEIKDSCQYKGLARKWSRFPPNKAICLWQMALFGGSAPCGRSTPMESNMLGASELPLRQDFAAQNTCDGAPAPPHFVGPGLAISILIRHDTSERTYAAAPPFQTANTTLVCDLRKRGIENENIRIGAT